MSVPRSNVSITIRVDEDMLRDALQGVARDAVVKVLERHGYNIPGVADLCAGAALRSVGLL